jgi:hypothetical protein
MMTDLAVALFVAVLVLGGIFVPRVGDAIGRRLRRGAPAEGGGAPSRPSDPRHRA